MAASLRERVKKLERDITAGQIPPAVMVFAGGTVDQWDGQAQAFADERHIRFEVYLCDAALRGHAKQARTLHQLRQLARQHQFNLVVLPTSEDATSIAGLWANHQAEGGAIH